MAKFIGNKIYITGIVQGVGFRPFIYGLAIRSSINGWVRNTSAGVEIQVEGTPKDLQSFLDAIHNEAPPLARIDGLTVDTCPSDGFTTFEIVHSTPIENAFQPVSPDVSICKDCLRELFEPTDRRYLYPFINCTNCGPRFTIISDIPYDRPNTTMAPFVMCPDCQSEYNDPLNRRFHAQPVACHDCGPHVWLEFNGVQNKPLDKKGLANISTDAIHKASQLLSGGKIVAIKGLGGFHLACDALNHTAVNELRHRKLRIDKPFALMLPDIETVEAHCILNEEELVLLQSPQRPVVLLKRKPESKISREVAPNQDTLGIMLPYTPLHYLLMSDILRIDLLDNNDSSKPVLVMTSGNKSEEPIAIDNLEAHDRLNQLVDAYLMHNRPIRTRCDDSVYRVYSGKINQSTAREGKASERTDAEFKITHNEPLNTYPIRRSRGYAPDPLHLPWELPSILATGSELKNTFCLTRDQYAFLSQHIGNMENYETLTSFEDGISQYERLFRIQPQAVAYDLHPNYLSTRYAQQRAKDDNLLSFAIQHHHAHIAACMAEHLLPSDSMVIGVAFDGTGYGTDGNIWGGEIFYAGYHSFTRVAHLNYIPLPGGDTSILNPARTALAFLWNAGVEWDTDIPAVSAICEEERLTICSMIENRINTPYTSSMGRFFDAISSLIGIRHKINYEAQAAIELEAIVDENENDSYPFSFTGRPLSESINGVTSTSIDTSPIISGVVNDYLRGVDKPIISARFHNSLANIVIEVCKSLRIITDCSQVVLSGGVWQNMTLLKKTTRELYNHNLNVLLHRKVPANDGGISLGQAVIAAHMINESGNQIF